MSEKRYAFRKGTVKLRLSHGGNRSIRDNR